MRFVKVEGVALHDCPDAVIFNGRRIPVVEGVGVHVSTGSVSVMDLFQVAGEAFHRYRIRTIYPWSRVEEVSFTYPPVEVVPADAWEKATEKVEDEKVVEKALEEYSDHWMNAPKPEGMQRLEQK